MNDAFGVAARTGADFVGRLGHISDMTCAALRVGAGSDSQRTCVLSGRVL